ncbi:muconolactone Delta-isomerase family protein [Pseudomonas fluorescens]|uniref:Muconolactone isomerase domain-containing protein n=1 Tax=Pseudomonas fluorescens TaxID=294 RepID=A0A5E7D4J2_PSEFL|nr:muconolactone Delta-isomerase family protein [Pseudomonas fluorescens]VVO02774.1 hypothetical protein PS691_02764 [Pseudomonas fluorescens]
MLYLVRMDVNIARDLPLEQADEIKAREKAKGDPARSSPICY